MCLFLLFFSGDFIKIVFTPISIDHCEILGNSIDKIANEKAGAIIKKEQRCISTRHNKKITNILNNQAIKYNIKVSYLNMQSSLKIDTKHLLGKHQQENALLAKYVIGILNDSQILSGTSDDAYKTMELLYRIYCADPIWKKKYKLSCD